MLLAPPPHFFGYVVAPLAVSRRGRRYGWRGGRPSKRNLVGLLPLAAGAGLIAWAAVSHYSESPPDRIQTSPVPEYLVTGGAYTLSRNPMYVGGMAMWTGWAVLLGSLPVAGAGAALFTGMAKVGVPFEERMLHKHFGSTYDSYRERVPRWLKLL